MKNEKSHNYGEIDIERPVLAPLDRKLMCAVLVKALQDVVGSSKQLSKMALEWFYEPEDDDEYVFSFLNICEILGVCPEKIRKAISDKENTIFKKNLRSRVSTPVIHPSQRRQFS